MKDRIFALQVASALHFSIVLSGRWADEYYKLQGTVSK